MTRSQWQLISAGRWPWRRSSRPRRLWDASISPLEAEFLELQGTAEGEISCFVGRGGVLRRRHSVVVRLFAREEADWLRGTTVRKLRDIISFRRRKQLPCQRTRAKSSCSLAGRGYEIAEVLSLFVRPLNGRARLRAKALVIETSCLIRTEVIKDSHLVCLDSDRDFETSERFEVPSTITPEASKTP